MPLVALAARAAGSLVCHQRPERSFTAGAGPFPVCARCTGLYLSGLIGALAAWRGRPRLPPHLRAVLLGAAVPTALTVAVEWGGIAAPSNLLRAAAALPLGGTAAWVIIRLLRAETRPIDAL